MKVWVVVTAAGSSRRMGGGNKLMRTVAGRPLLVHTLAYFEQHPRVDGVVVSAPPDQVDNYRALFEEHGLVRVGAVVAGGAERQDSIRHALAALRAAPEDAVAIHDGARPCLAPDLLDRLLAALDGVAGSLPMVAVKDTIKRVDEQGVVVNTLRRSELFAAQTPQVFRYAAIAEAHRRAHQEGYLGTDDCSLIEYFGGTVRMVQGDYANVKVTTPEDMEMVASYFV